MCRTRAKAAFRAGAAVVLAGLLLASSGCEPGRERSEDRLGESGESARGGITSLEGESRARRLYYQFVDGRGRVHFVERLDAVPAEWRATMGYVELDVPPPLSPLEARRARAGLAGRGAKTRSGEASQVVLYSAEWCGACRKARRHLKRRRVRYELRDVDQPEHLEALLERTGRRGIPVLEVDGRIVTGFSAKRYDELLARS